ncbi:hypothetical protein M9Y10_011745 [Tritrichomonas musculus]|uniref:Uncharacterized protein n=1 Tax=Tritrichomonas musculus TaxID=1915356 RepID=A0ABR2ILF4_9EUKA
MDEKSVSEKIDKILINKFEDFELKIQLQPRSPLINSIEKETNSQNTIDNRDPNEAGKDNSINTIENKIQNQNTTDGQAADTINDNNAPVNINGEINQEDDNNNQFLIKAIETPNSTFNLVIPDNYDPLVLYNQILDMYDNYTDEKIRNNLSYLMIGIIKAKDGKIDPDIIQNWKNTEKQGQLSLIQKRLDFLISETQIQNEIILCNLAISLAKLDIIEYTMWLRHELIMNLNSQQKISFFNSITYLQQLMSMMPKQSTSEEQVAGQSNFEQINSDQQQISEEQISDQSNFEQQQIPKEQISDQSNFEQSDLGQSNSQQKQTPDLQAPDQSNFEYTNREQQTLEHTTQEPNQIVENQQIANDQTSNQPIPEYLIAYHITILQFLLENNIPIQIDPYYDERVNNICNIFNFFLDYDYDSEILSKVIKKTILKGIKDALSKFNAFYCSLDNLSLQLNHLLKLTDQYSGEPISMIYDCLIISISKYYENIMNNIMTKIFSISISHLDGENDDSLCALEFWEKVAKTEKEIGFKRSKRYTLGIINYKRKENSIPYFVEHYLFSFISMSDPINIEPDDMNFAEKISEMAENCLVMITKAEPDAMFEILKQYYSENRNNSKPKDRYSALISFRTIVSISEIEEFDFIEQELESIFKFALNINEKLKYVSIKILKRILKKSPFIIINNEEKVKKLLEIIQANQKSHSLILTECYNILALILKHLSQPNSKFIYDNFDSFYSFISQASDDPDVQNAATDSFIELVDKAPINNNSYDCSEKILKILEDFLNEEYVDSNGNAENVSSKKAGNETNDGSNEKVGNFPGNPFNMLDISFSTKQKIYICSLPFIIKKLQSKLTDEIVDKVMYKILLLINSDMYDEVILALIDFIPLTKVISTDAKGNQFGEQILQILIKYHKKHGPLTMIYSSDALTSLFETFNGILKSNFNEVSSILLSDFSDKIVFIRPYVSVFHLFSSIIEIMANEKENTESFSVFRDELLKNIEKFLADLNAINPTIDDDVLSLYYEILCTYFAIFNVFQNDKNFIKRNQKKVLMLIKKLERMDICYYGLLVTSIKIIFVIICSLGSTIFIELKQPLIEKVITKGSNYIDDEIVSSTSIRILNILNNYNNN